MAARVGSFTARLVASGREPWFEVIRRPLPSARLAVALPPLGASLL